MGSQVQDYPGGEDAVAIVGLACRLPGEARDEKGFWELLSQGKSAYSEASKRWNVDAFHHPARGRLNTSITRGGHFVDQDVTAFDAGFFKMSPAEAASLDPQQRFMLEVSYEALENAGMPLHQVAGSKTGCFVGSFGMDWREALSKDIEALPKHAYVGSAPEFLSQRVSWFFDLKGPSISMATACSSSLVALHMACQSLKTGESDMALAGGANLILNPDVFLQASNQRLLAKDGRCKTFNAAGDGYGRGEGCGLVVLKRVHDAIRDGDSIRAVIRGSGSNQDGKTPTITKPCPQAQADLIRSVYRQAGLDMADTPYFEAHGTGTKVGDPIELEAISKTISAAQKGRRLIVGHLEGAAGIVGVIKGVLAIEKHMIPPNIHFNNPNPEIPFDDWNIQVPQTLIPWPTGALRRFSVNSFGAGGTNAHAVIESLQDFLHSLSGYNELPIQPSTTQGIQKQPRVFVLRSEDREGLGRQRAALLTHLENKVDNFSNTDEEQVYLSKLAQTLDKYRSRLSWACSSTASSISGLMNSLQDPSIKPVRSGQPFQLNFVFSGQGAQWPRMGLELLDHNVFRESVTSADTYLRDTLKCSWSVLEELEKSADTSRVNESSLAQVLLTILQVALVELLDAWKIKPDAVVGHSSGEVAAAFCIGALTREQAWTISYAKGSALPHLDTALLGGKGAMLAAGCSEAEATEILAKVKTGRAVVACINSPASVTISGDKSAVNEAQALLRARNVFERKLRVDHAYHSHHMEMIASVFEDKIGVVTPQMGTGTRMYSSVKGGLIEPQDLTPQYWVSNMVSPVRFSQAVDALMEDSGTDQRTQILLEIGPHAALKGPLQQILKQSGISDFEYLSPMIRGKDASHTAVECAGHLSLFGVPVATNPSQKNLYRHAPLSDLPGYAWNHSRSYSHEPRLSKESRLRSNGKRDLIGPSFPRLLPNTHIWRGFLRRAEEPWIQDHCIQGAVVYPASGFVAMAIEAVRQIADSSREIKFFRLRDVHISQAAVIPEGSDLEAIISFSPRGDATSSTSNWWEFELSTCVDGATVSENSRGLIQVEYASSPNSAMEHELQLHTRNILQRVSDTSSSCNNLVEVPSFYDRLRGLGLQYGTTFQRVTEAAFGKNQSFCTVSTADTGSSFVTNSAKNAHIVHPSTLDAILHSILASTTVQDGITKTAMVPSKIGEITVDAAMPAGSGMHFKVASMAEKHGFHGMKSHTDVSSADLSLYHLSMTDVQWSPIDALNSERVEASVERKLFFTSSWEPAVHLMTPAELQRWADGQSLEACLTTLIDLAPASSSPLSIAEAVTADSTPTLFELFKNSHNAMRTSLTILTPDQHTADTLRESKPEALPEVTFVVTGQLQDDTLQEAQFDLIIRPSTDTNNVSVWQRLLKAENSYILQQTESHLSITQIPKELVSAGQKSNGHDYEVLIIESSSGSKSLIELGDRVAAQLLQHSYAPRRVTWGSKDLDLSGKRCIFLQDPSAPFLANMDESEFSLLKTLILSAWDIFWAAPSDCSDSGLISGLSRVVRNERPGLRFVTIFSDMETVSSFNSTAEMLTRVVLSHSPDDEYLFDEGTIKISRIHEDKDNNDSLARMMRHAIQPMAIGDSESHLRLGVQTPGMLSSLRFEPDSSLDATLQQDEVDIQVHSSGINFRDVLTAMGEIPDDHLGREAAGTVIRVGKSVSRLQPGDRVCCLASGAHRTSLRVKEAFCQRIPTSLTFDEAASLPVVYCTAYHALVNLARLEAAQSILIHSGAGGVGQAAIQVAKWLDLEVFTTVGTQEKRESITSLYGIPNDHIFSSRDPSFAKAILRATDGRGVDSVLNSLSGEMLRQTWNCLAPFGTFVEIGMKDILKNSGLEMRPFLKNATFCFFNLESMEKDRKRLGRLMESTFSLIRRGILQPVTPVVSYPASEVESAFRLMQAGKHRGKLTLSFRPEDVVPVCQNGDGIGRLSADATYLLVGGLGGLGRSLSHLLVNSGAKHLCFVSRSGDSSPKAKALVSELEGRGAVVRVIASDVADEVSLMAAVEETSTTMPPIKGVIHAAMVLRDGLFENMSYQQWTESLRPKVQGTANLDKHLPADLDFFLILSSFSGVFGNRGQSNYAAGCAYQDAVAETRRKKGLKTLSLDLGIIQDVGVLAESNVPKSIRPWVKPFGIREKELHLLIKLAIQSQTSSDWQTRPAQMITGLATGDTAHSSSVFPYYLKHPRFSKIAVRHHNDDASASLGASKGVSSQVQASKTIQEARQTIISVFTDHLGKFLQIPTTEIDTSRPLFTYGVDSLVAMEMRNWIATEFKADLGLFDITAHVPITDLVGKIAEKSQFVQVEAD
ncbi:KR domain-containing protein [Sarocladium implicatum]|nr:KR domain-containing protein [Sarocladium implicatum]